MMFFSRKKSATSGTQAKGDHPNVSQWGRSRPAGPGEAAFKAHNCALWNDVTRALDAKPKGTK